jgi:hypothetical protein
VCPGSLLDELIQGQGIIVRPMARKPATTAHRITSQPRTRPSRPGGQLKEILPHMLVADLRRSWPGILRQETLVPFSLVAGLRPTPSQGRGPQIHVRKLVLNWEPPYGIEP